MKERPILFSAPMVRALLDGSKTQTRRIVKPQPDHPAFAKHHMLASDDESIDLYLHSSTLHRAIRCPYGQLGDRLWVRENFAPRSDDEMSYARWMTGDRSGPSPEIMFAADRGDPYITRWRPSIHMPRWACRVTLEIVSVRVERLQDISEADAKAEGCEPAECCYAYYHGYSKLWESINGAGSWDANPWVWCIEFKQIADTTKDKP
jgi:hypothetical protein